MLVESQNQKVAEIGRDLWRPSGPTTMLKQCRLDWLPRSMSRWLLNISKEEDSTTSVGNLWKRLVTPSVKKCLLMFRGNLLRFNLWLSPLGLSLTTTEKCLVPFALNSLFRCLYTLIRIPWDFTRTYWVVPALSAFPDMRDVPIDCIYMCFVFFLLKHFYGVSKTPETELLFH